jgi:hypothetical protein
LSRRNQIPLAMARSAGRSSPIAQVARGTTKWAPTGALNERYATGRIVPYGGHLLFRPLRGPCFRWHRPSFACP